MCEGQHRCVPLQRYTFSLRVIRGLGLYSYAEFYSLFIVQRYRTLSSPDMPPKRDTQALRLITSISLIPWREKCRSCEGKSAFT